MRRIQLYILIILSISTTSLFSQTYISNSDAVWIGSSSIGSVALGSYINKINSNGKSLINGPLPFERNLQHLLGGECLAGKSNFLDSDFGSAIAPFSGSILLLAADLKYPQGDKSKTVLQDQYLYISGLVATKGITSIFKGLVNRERPLPCLAPQEAAKREHIDRRYDHQSFFSGHTSSAFFSMSFLNNRIRSIMRSQLTSSEYRNWRWVSPVMTFSWASYVGWSRIHAYKHFVSDVLVGAAVGHLISELFLSFGDEFYNKTPNQQAQNMIQITIKF